MQGNKGTKIFEGRAMIAGNICMNRMHGIIYPAFELKTPKDGKTETIKQNVTPAASMDASAAIGVSMIETRVSAVGFSTL